MRAVEIEVWTLRVLDSIDRGSPIEDSFVELKANFIDPKKAARRLGALANSAFPDPALFILGASEEAGALGIDPSRYADWHTQVVACFNEIAPTLRELAVVHRGVTVLAISVETDRAPFLVQNPAFGRSAGEAVEFEVPIRDGTKARTARRSELIRLLMPRSPAPECYAYAGRVSAADFGTDETRGREFQWHAWVDLYLIPRSDRRLVYPLHKVSFEYRLPGGTQWRVPLGVSLTSMVVSRGAAKPSHTIRTSHHEAIVEGPGMLRLLAEWGSGKLPSGPEPFSLRASLTPADGSGSVGAELLLEPCARGSGDVATWEFSEGAS